jgi:hypothetical protein
MARRLPSAAARPHHRGRTPEVGRVAIHGTTVHFRTASRHLEAWLGRIDRWVAYANSVVKE